MSTFRGFIKEIPKIRVDYFEQPEDDTLFFLSHCHTDHMVGIKNLASMEHATLVVSKVTSVILTNLHPELKNILEIIEIGHEKMYTLEDGQTMLCTAIPAGHCPGSVMFYYQTHKANVLYTGDFRWRTKDLKQLKILKSVKEDLQSIYIDSTFLLPEYYEFPDQRDSVSVVEKLIKEWIDKDDLNRVFLEIPARFGSEFLLLELYKRLKLEMHLLDVDQSCLLPFIPEMREFIVPVLTHRVKLVVGMRTSELNPKFKWRTIRPSAMYWQNWTKNDPISKRDPIRKELFRICYSSHSSCSELMAVLNMLQPRVVNLNVQPDGREDRRWEQMKFFRRIKTAEQELEEEREKERKLKPKPKEEDDDTKKCYFFVADPQTGYENYKEMLEKVMAGGEIE